MGRAALLRRRQSPDAPLRETEEAEGGEAADRVRAFLPKDRRPSKRPSPINRFSTQQISRCNICTHRVDVLNISIQHV